jgi:hypothetical protein
MQGRIWHVWLWDDAPTGIHVAFSQVKALRRLEQNEWEVTWVNTTRRPPVLQTCVVQATHVRHAMRLVPRHSS